ncbi:MAG: glutamate carboxypeptidase, partial [Gemmatimonadota bacterium]|nr:glutamate carboxypeptidase [Gemmatimonadota bacterium]
ANADVLPFDYAATARTVMGYLTEVEDAAEASGIPLDLSDARTEARRLGQAAVGLQEEMTRIFNGFTPDELRGFRPVFREINSHLISVERGFLHEEGLPGRPWYRHQLYAPGYLTGYGAKTLPGIREAVEGGRAEEARAMAIVLTGRLQEATSRLRRALLLSRGVLPPLG